MLNTFDDVMDLAMWAWLFSFSMGIYYGSFLHRFLAQPYGLADENFFS